MNYQDIMRKAIGNRSIAEFSDLCGISSKKISDCIHGRYSDFTDYEISRIAGNAHNGVTYTELYDYFNENETQKYTIKDVMDSIEVFAKAVKFYFEHLSNITIFKDTAYQYVSDVVDIVSSYYPRFGQEVNVFPDFGIDLYWTDDKTLIIQLSWVDHGFTVVWEFGIIISDDSTVNYVAFSKEELYRLGSELAGHFDMSDGFSEILGFDYAIEMYIKKDQSENLLKQFTAEEKLLCAIFGESTQPRTIEGYGFDLPDKTKLYEFCKNHNESINSKSEEKLDSYSDRMFGYLIADIILKETGIRTYSYYTHDTRCIMYPTKLPWDMSEYEKHITKKHLYSVLDKYAKELGTTVKKCYVATTKKSDSEFDDLNNI